LLVLDYDFLLKIDYDFLLKNEDRFCNDYYLDKDLCFDVLVLYKDD